MKVGSLVWRLFNYGPVPTAKYVRNRVKQKVTPQNNGIETSSINLVFNDLELGLKSEIEIQKSKRMVEEFLVLLRPQSYQLDKPSPLKDVLSEAASFERLIVLNYLIRSQKPALYIETGTQHGLSAGLVAWTVEQEKLDTRVITFDVIEQPLLYKSEIVRYEILQFPSRVRFRLKNLEKSVTNSIFFHDSDHSYENMMFEFDWMWNKMKVKTLISDDIDGNSAFFDFCLKNGLTGHRIIVDKGPALGIISR